MHSHYWIRAGQRRDRRSERDRLELPPVLADVNAHRRLRGPYTAAGAMIRQILPAALREVPELGPRHHIEILTAAPEFAGQVPPIKATLELDGRSGVRTRYQARVHTLRIAHGLADLLGGYLAALADGPRSLLVEDAHEADPTDQELLAVLLSRFAPDLLTVVLGTGVEPLSEPPGPVSLSLPRMLAERTRAVDAPPAPVPPPEAAGLDPGALAAAYVAAECLDEHPGRREAYRRMPAPARAALHDARLAALVARGEPSLLLGAVPFHAERGSDPAGVGVAAVREAQLRCKGLGLYHAAADLGVRGRALVDRQAAPDLWWDLTGDMTTSLAAIGRADEAEAHYDELRTITTDPELQMHLAYGTAMLYARHYPDDRRDPRRARAWLNLAVALSSQLPDRKERAFYTVFNGNGIALVDVREGRLPDALQRLNEGMARLDRELEPEDYLLHRAGLRYNRAQVHMISGRLDEALADFTHVIGQDPNFHDHYFNRGNILGRLGRYAEAIADYDQALELSPPFVEAYYNRGDARLELGDVEGALGDFSRALELDPTHTAAWLNRGSIRCERGDLDGAWADAGAGLDVDPDHAQLWCLRGRVLAERGEAEAAGSALDTALRLDGDLAEAYAIRGELAFARGDLAAAISDLDRAVELRGTVEMRFNRAVVYQAAQRFAEAIVDFDAFLAQQDDPEARDRRQTCLAATRVSQEVG